MTLCAIVGSVALPQIVHLVGAAAGIGNSLGELLLPMHFFVLLAGLLAGPAVGAVTGACAPLLSYLLSGMPREAVLPFMMIELIGYGLLAGLVSATRFNSFVKLLLAQLGGRVLRAAAVLVAVYGAGLQTVSVESIGGRFPRVCLVFCYSGASFRCCCSACVRTVTDMIDAIRAKTLLHEANHTCVLCRGDVTHVSDRIGIAPMMEFLDAGLELRGFCAADRIVGKAAALLFVLAGVCAVYADVMSENALDQGVLSDSNPLYHQSEGGRSLPDGACGA